MGNLSRSMLLLFIFLETNSSFFFKEKTKKNVPVKYLDSLMGVLSQSNLGLDNIIHLIH